MTKKLKNIEDIHSRFRAIMTGKQPTRGSINLDSNYFSTHFNREGKRIVKKEIPKQLEEEKKKSTTSPTSVEEDWKKVGERLKELYGEDTLTFSLEDLNKKSLKTTPQKQELKKADTKYKPIVQLGQQKLELKLKVLKKDNLVKKELPMQEKPKEKLQLQKQDKKNNIKAGDIKNKIERLQGLDINRPTEKISQKTQKSSMALLSEKLREAQKKEIEKRLKRRKEVKKWADNYFHLNEKKTQNDKKLTPSTQNNKVTHKSEYKIIDTDKVNQNKFIKKSYLNELESPYEYRSKTGKEKYLEELARNEKKRLEYLSKLPSFLQLAEAKAANYALTHDIPENSILGREIHKRHSGGYPDLAKQILFNYYNSRMWDKDLRNYVPFISESYVPDNASEALIKRFGDMNKYYLLKGATKEYKKLKKLGGDSLTLQKLQDIIYNNSGYYDKNYYFNIDPYENPYRK